MSRFRTSIPTEIAAFIKSLPPHSTIEDVLCQITTRDFAGRVALSQESDNIIVVWENPAWESGKTVPVDYPLDLLIRNKPPKLAARASAYKKAIEAQNLPKNAPEAAPEPINIHKPHYLTEQEVMEAIANGEKIEFQGIEPGWMPFEKGRHTFTEGFYYRKAVVDSPAVSSVS